MSLLLSKIVSRIAVLLLLAATAGTQVDLQPDAAVWFGSASNTSAPATIDAGKVREATPEWQKIRARGIPRGSARFLLLAGRMHQRIRSAVRVAAIAATRDLVVRVGDIVDVRGRRVVDLTAAVIAGL